MKPVSLAAALVLQATLATVALGARLTSPDPSLAYPAASLTAPDVIYVVSGTLSSSGSSGSTPSVALPFGGVGTEFSWTSQSIVQPAGSITTNGIVSGGTALIDIAAYLSLQTAGGEDSFGVELVVEAYVRARRACFESECLSSGSLSISRSQGCTASRGPFALAQWGDESFGSLAFCTSDGSLALSPVTCSEMSVSCSDPVEFPEYLGVEYTLAVARQWNGVVSQRTVLGSDTRAVGVAMNTSLTLEVTRLGTNDDFDGDGLSECAGDCNDSDENSFPGATEICDNLDNNCDGVIDNGFDLDGDGFTTCNGDCDDSDPFISPAGDEICDAYDNDCDAALDEGCGASEPGQCEFPRTYTTDSDFDSGRLFNVNHSMPNNDQLQLNEQIRPLPYINVALSGRGTIARINVNNGQIVGEYRTAPEGFARNPSRTTVDLFGNVWCGNRDEAGGGLGSVVKIGIVIGGTRVNSAGQPDENGEYLRGPFLYNTCRDRDGDGLIRTSRGSGHILPWVNRTDGAGGDPAFVEDAADECIQIFQRVRTTRVRHVSIDRNNNVWVGGHLDGANKRFDLLDGETGRILSGFGLNLGGYGGLVDGNGVLWSTNQTGTQGVLRYDPKNTPDTSDDTSSFIPFPGAYGMGLDPEGNIWVAMYSAGQVMKLLPDGSVAPGFPKGVDGGVGSRGLAVDPMGDVWLAKSPQNRLLRLGNDGLFKKRFGVGAEPTGVSVDTKGKIWVTNYNSWTVSRINPRGGVDGLGEVDMTVNLGSNAYPYNYSDMTGDVLARNTAPRGSWNIVCDGVKPGTEWGTISWLESTPDSTDIIVEVRAADEQVNLAQKVFIPVDNDSTFEGISGRFIEVQVILSRARGGLPSPVLYELTIAPRVLNQPPDCSAAAASLAELWPADHAMVPVNILGISDPDSDAVVVEILGVTSDESVDATGDGNFCADAVIDGENVLLRSERSGNGDGRVYTITYRARDERGAQCEGSVTVCVPKSQGIRGRACLKGTSEFDATACGDKVSEPSARVVDESGRKRISVLQQDPGRVDINIYDVTGRLIRRIAGDDVGAGQHEWYWDGRDEQNRRASAGIYFIRVQTPDISRTMRILWLAR